MLYESRKTDSGVLPQPRTLESMPADTPGVGTKRGMEAAARVGATVVQPGRGESRREAAVAPQGAGREATNTTVFVLDRHKRPLMPTTERRARKLLKQGRAVVHRGFPFTIRIKDRTVAESQVDGLVLGIDPGSRHTGLALSRHSESIDTATGEVAQVRTGVWLGELVHRGLAIKKAMVAVQAALDAARPEVLMIMQVHDELVFELPEGDVDWLRAEVPALMAGVAELKVPLLAEVGVGPNWDKAH